MVVIPSDTHLEGGGGRPASGTPTASAVSPDAPADVDQSDVAPSAPVPTGPAPVGVVPPLVRLYRVVGWVLAALILVAAGIAIVVALSSLQPVA